MRNNIENLLLKIITKKGKRILIVTDNIPSMKNMIKESASNLHKESGNIIPLPKYYINDNKFTYENESLIYILNKNTIDNIRGLSFHLAALDHDVEDYILHDCIYPSLMLNDGRIIKLGEDYE